MLVEVPQLAVRLELAKRLGRLDLVTVEQLRHLVELARLGIDLLEPGAQLLRLAPRKITPWYMESPRPVSASPQTIMRPFCIMKPDM